MKKQFTNCSLVFLFLLLMLSSCTYSQSFVPVRGSGMPVDRNYSVSDFRGIDVSGGFDVTLIQGNTESVTLTAQENLFDHIIVKVDNGSLKIYTRNNLIMTRQLKARITFKSIDNLKVSGGGDVTSETPVNAESLDVYISGGGNFSSVINSEELKCHLSGGGDAEISGRTKVYNLDISGGGNLKSDLNASIISCRIAGGGDLYLMNEDKASDADIDINGGGNMDLKINTEKLKCSVTGGGDARLFGQASEFEININGGGDADASNLSTGITSFYATGGSDIHVNVSKELRGQISGGGDVYYSGNPERVSVDARGGSEVHKE
jgi:Putative auto-transporter adhesin, head GIN domain